MKFFIIFSKFNDCKNVKNTLKIIEIIELYENKENNITYKSIRYDFWTTGVLIKNTKFTKVHRVYISTS